MLIGHFLTACFLVTAASGPELEIVIDYRMKLPREQREAEILPTPYKLVSPVGNDNRQLVFSGYGPLSATFNPPISVSFDSENFDFDSALERDQQMAVEYQRSFNIGIAERDAERIEDQRIQNIQDWQSSYIENAPRIESRGQMRALLSSDQNALLLQLNGSPVFFPGYDQNYRMDIPIVRDSKVRAQTQRQTLETQIDMGAILLESWQTDWTELRYHFYRNSIGINQSVLTSSIPSIFLDRIDEYLNQMTRHKKGKDFKAGMEKRGTTYYGYIHSNCVVFSERDDQDFVDFDPERLCWEFDRSQAGKILPILASKPTASSKYVVERHLTKVNGDEEESRQEISLLPSYFVNLQEMSW